MKITITRSQKQIEKNSGSLSIKDLTTGQMMSIYNALKQYSETSPIANEVLEFLHIELKDHWKKVIE